VVLRGLRRNERTHAGIGLNTTDVMTWLCLHLYGMVEGTARRIRRCLPPMPGALVPLLTSWISTLRPASLK